MRKFPNHAGCDEQMFMTKDIQDCAGCDDQMCTLCDVPREFRPKHRQFQYRLHFSICQRLELRFSHSKMSRFAVRIRKFSIRRQKNIPRCESHRNCVLLTRLTRASIRIDSLARSIRSNWPQCCLACFTARGNASNR